MGRQYAEPGLAGLDDAPRGGGPVTVLTGQAVCEILAATATPPPESPQEQGITHWSSRRRADWPGRPENQRITLHVTPAGCSWLNLVECFFFALTRQAIRRGSFTSVRQLTAAIGARSPAAGTITPAVCLDQGRRRDPRQHPARED